MRTIQQAQTVVNAPRAFRSDIQALRAVAVGAVLLNHLWPNRMPGGYIGVDVFFVISGFLITTHLLREADKTGKIQLSRFYVRRIKRLLPAAFTVIIVSLVCVALWVPPERWGNIAKEAVGSLLYVENWVLTASSVDYSARSLDATPFQHYWSLSVEEQFYLLWPIVLIAVLLISLRMRYSSRRLFSLMTVILAAASFLFSLLLTQGAPEVAYFHTFSRAWEFLVGGLVALNAEKVGHWFETRRGAAFQGVIGWLGALLILWSAFFFTPETLFPGPWAVIPVLATALIIISGPVLPSWSPFALAKWRPIQYMGDISYSLYLWHWPIIVIAPFAVSREFGHFERSVILLASFILAGLTKKFIEDPGRTQLLPNAQPRTVFVALVTVSALLVVANVGLIRSGKMLEERAFQSAEALKESACFGAGSLEGQSECGDPFGPAVVAPQGDHNTPWFSPPECVTASEEEQILVNGKSSLVGCDFSAGFEAAEGNPVEPLHIWIVGDSHAEHWKAAIYDLARGNGWVVTSSMHGGCPAVAAPLTMFDGGEVSAEVRDACLHWTSEVSTRIQQDKPDLIITSAFSSAEIVDDGTGRSQESQLADALSETAGRWLLDGAKLVVIRDVPRAGEKLGASCVLKFGDSARGCTAPVEEVLPEDPFATAANALNLDNVKTVDLSDYFCAGGVCSGVVGGLPVYFDHDHISRSFSATLAPALGTALSEATGIHVNPPAR